jgi:hypothetical protein
LNQHTKNKKSSKKAWLVGLIILTLLGCSASFILWNTARTIRYNHVRSHKLNTSNQQTLIISIADAASLVWVEKDEICYKGKLFDVRHQETIGDKIILTGCYDEFEDKLFKILPRIIDNDANTRTKNKKQILSWVFDAIIPTENATLVDDCLIGSTYSLRPISKYISVVSSPPFPPPTLSI